MPDLNRASSLCDAQIAERQSSTNDDTSRSMNLLEIMQESQSATAGTRTDNRMELRAVGQGLVGAPRFEEVLPLQKAPELVKDKASFVESVNHALRQGQQNEHKLLLDVAEIVRYGDKDLERQMDKAVLGCALGQLFLEKGTRVNRTSNERVNFGENLDLGGQATTCLRWSQDILSRKEEQADGKDAEELNKMRSHVQSSIDKIHGDHNLTTDENGAFFKLKRYAQSGSSEQQNLRHLALELNSILRTVNVSSENKDFMAKALRDSALLTLVIADGKVNKDNEGTKILLDSVDITLQKAKALDPHHGQKDLKQMTEALEKLRQGERVEPPVPPKFQMDSRDLSLLKHINQVSGMAGLAATSYWRETATVADRLKLLGTTEGKVLESASLGSLRGQLRTLEQAGHLAKNEAQVLRGIETRGVVKGLVAGLGAIAVNEAMDETIFGDARYGMASAVADSTLPLIALAPTNVYLKAGLMMGVHATGRLIDKYKD